MVSNGMLKGEKMENLLSNSPPLDYSKYINRLNTYAVKRWPESAPQFIKDLAEAGLVFTGKDDLVYCFECGIELSDWLDHHEPFQRHKNTNSKCLFVVQLCRQKQDQIPNEEEFYNQNMKSENKRFQTFAMGPDKKHWPSPEKLAKSGLYYDNKIKKMVCFCCGFMVDSWESAEQDPYVKHRVESSCRFIEDVLNRIRVYPLIQAPINRNNNKENPSPTNEKISTSLETTLLEENHSYKSEWTKPAIELDYSNEHTRLQTFFSYPRNSPVSADSLVKAGFYYMGRNDEVTCYKCKVSLKDFENGDTAWGEHKRHSPTCPLVERYFGLEGKESPTHHVLRNQSGNLALYRSSSENQNTGLTSIQNVSPSDFNSRDSCCIICMVNKVEMRFSPCGHLVACGICVKNLSLCPICRKPIESTLKTYLS